MIGPVCGPLAGLSASSIVVEPDFAQATFELESRGVIRVIPLQFAWLTLGLVLSPGFWRGVNAARRRRRG